MKTVGTVLFICLIMPFVAFSQSGWICQNPRPTANDLNAVKMLDTNTIVAVGSYGTIIKTTNGGGTWTTQAPPARSAFYGVDFSSSTTGVAVGATGTIARTIDGGQTWGAVSSGTTKLLYAVDLISTGVGLAVGASGTIVRTTDGGASWTSVTSGVTSTLYSVSMVNGNALISGDLGTILRSTDAGLTWTKLTSNVTVSLNGISLLDALNATVVGDYSTTDYYATILQTTDLGNTWTKIPTTIGQSLTGVTMFSKNVRAVIGKFATCARTTDGGTTWNLQGGNIDLMNNLGHSFADQLHGVVVSPHGIIYKTSNGGTGYPDWTPMYTGHAVTLYGLSFLGTNAGVAAGVGGTLFNTLDGGATWTESKPGSQQFMGVSYVAANRIIGVGWSGYIEVTATGGKTWTVKTSGVTKDLQEVKVNGPSGYAVGYGATILRTNDSGETWKQQTPPIPANYNLFDVAIPTPANAFVVGDHGVILRTVDGGLTWTLKQIDTTVTVYGVSFADNNIGTIVGSKASIYRTTDGGLTWNAQVSPEVATATYASVSFFDANTGIATAFGGLIDRTTNGGTKWEKVESGTTNALECVRMVDSKTAFIAGDYGTIMKTTDLGGSAVVSSVEKISGNNVPVTFSLDQNYPNPFNPATTIRFTVPQSGRVHLQVYDLLGRVVATLLDEQKTAGTYIVTFNAGRLASGTYIYRLNAAGVEETRKMMLLK